MKVKDLHESTNELQKAVDKFVKQLNAYSKKNEENYFVYGYQKGKSYYKMYKDIKGNANQRSVYAFIVANPNDSTFEVGDILKASGWKSPARNKSRGNLLSGNYKVDDNSKYSYS